MIRINLLGEKQDKSGIYLLQTVALFAVLLCTLTVCFIVHNGKLDTLETVKNEEQTLNTRLVKLQKKTKKVEKLEEKKKLLREKLHTIAQLKANKQGPVRLLDDVTTALPDHSWLESITETSGYLEVNGIALDNQTISLFMYELGKSKFIDQVKLVYSRLFIKENVKLKKFSLNVRLQPTLSLKKVKEELDSKDVVGEDKKRDAEDLLKRIQEKT